jgi:hypothetical protein
MRILWQNILAILLLGLLASVIFEQRPAVDRFLGSIGHIGPGYPAAEQAQGLIALCVVIVGVIVAMKALHRNRKH